MQDWRSVAAGFSLKEFLPDPLYGVVLQFHAYMCSVEKTTC